MRPRRTLVRIRRALAIVVAVIPSALVVAQTPDTLNPSPSNPVYAMGVHTDGSLLFGGSFTFFSGSRNGLARLESNNFLDQSFNPGINSLANVTVHSLNLQLNGDILVGGTFTNLGNVPRNRLARLKSDGITDVHFNPAASTNVYALATQLDGKILVAGGFTNLAGQPCPYLGRLNVDGTLDNTFLPALNGPVHTILIQTDERILIGGDFTTIDGTPREHLARLEANGSLDTGFDPGADGPVYCFALQSNERIICGGSFTNLGGQPRQGIARLEPDGVLDSSFAPEVSGEIRSLALQTDGRIFAGGSFTNVNGLIRSNLVRFDVTGVVDNYSPNPNAAVVGLALQTDGKLMVGGNFTSIGGFSRSRFARLSNDIPATQSLTLNGSTLTWLRGGSTPEVYRATFAYTTNGSDWIDLTQPSRIAGGWESTAVLVPANATLRARGEVRGGYHNGSTWFIENSIGPAAISMQPEDRIAIPNTPPARFTVGAAGTGPFTYRWYRNGALIFTSPNPSYSPSPSAVSYYEVLVSNAVSTVRSRVATLWVGSADSFNGGLANTVNALLPQPDGSIVAGGLITTIVRFDPDGMLDSTFSASVNGAVNCLAPQTNGMVLAAGAFTTVTGQTRNRLARLDASGKLDPTFNPNASGTVNALAMQPDGRILVGGAFTNLGGVSHPYLGRLNADGTPDNSFNPFANGIVHSLAVQPDGMILVGGAFSMVNGSTRIRIARLFADGSLDSSFNPAPLGTSVFCLVVQPDGKILVGGNFTSLAGQARSRIGRLNPDGSLDLSFNPVASSDVMTLQLQPDGRIWVGGAFSTLGGQTRIGLGRLNPDGSLDPLTGNPNVGTVFSVALQADGKLVVGGSFTSLYGTSRSRLGRLNNTAAATQNLTSVGGTLTWQRGGSGPEIHRATFDYCTNGVDWVELPTPNRIVGGWQTTSTGVPTNATIRARGDAIGGHNAGSAYFVETGRGPTVISMQPVSQSVVFGSSERLSVTAVGDGPFTYQWYREGVALPNETNSWLTVLGLSPTYTYDVVVTGPNGTVRSQPAQIWTYGTDLSFNPGADGAVQALALQGDRKILAGGAFTNSPGGGIARLHPNGATDTSFTPVSSGGGIRTFALQSDGKIVVGGVFTNLSGQPRSALGRLNSDGSVDSAFNPQVFGLYGTVVHCLAIQSDGKILAGGGFEFLAGQNRYCLGRLNADGSLDTGFVPPAGGFPGIEAGVTSIIIENSGTILVTGELKDPPPNPNWTTYVQRLNSDGSRLHRVYANYSATPVPPSFVICAAAQPDGGIILGGWFDWFEGGQLHRNLARLDPSGFLDLSFTNTADGPVNALAVQVDGKVVVGGSFTTIAGLTRNRLARLNANGTPDVAFDLQLSGSGSVESLAIQPDGRILVGGSFTNLASRARNNIGRLNNLEFGTSALQSNGSDVTWWRGSVTPEVTSTILETSNDGLNWNSVGGGTRVASSWRWNGVSFPSDALLRARGFIGGNSSFWFVEDYLATSLPTPPTILTSTGSVGIYTNRFGLHVNGSFGHLAVVEASTNFVSWTRLQTNRLYVAPVFFGDTTWTNYPRRFYRAYLQ